MLNYNVNATHLHQENNVFLEWAQKENGWVTGLDVGGGFMMIRRRDVERMIEKCPDRQYKSFENNFKLPSILYNLFHSYVDPESKYYISEDYGFCALHRSLGGIIRIQTTLRLGHRGNDVFEGSLFQSIFLQHFYQTNTIGFQQPTATATATEAATKEEKMRENENGEEEDGEEEDESKGDSIDKDADWSEPIYCTVNDYKDIGLGKYLDQQFHS